MKAHEEDQVGRVPLCVLVGVCGRPLLHLPSWCSLYMLEFRVVVHLAQGWLPGCFKTIFSLL